MVARDRQEARLERLLAAARLDAVRATPGIRQVRLDTTQHSAGFCRRFGFVVERIVPSGYGPGLDRRDMILPL